MKFLDHLQFPSYGPSDRLFVLWSMGSGSHSLNAFLFLQLIICLWQPSVLPTTISKSMYNTFTFMSFIHCNHHMIICNLNWLSWISSASVSCISPHTVYSPGYLTSGCPAVRESQGNSRLGKSQGKVKEFCWRSGKKWILGKVREK